MGCGSSNPSIPNPLLHSKAKRQKGLSIFEDGGRYEGEYSMTDGVTRSGKGTYHFASGDVYTGEL